MSKFARVRAFAPIIAAVIGLVILLTVALPISVSVIEDLNTTWLTANSPNTVTVVNLVPLFIGLGILMFAVTAFLGM